MPKGRVLPLVSPAQLARTLAASTPKGKWADTSLACRDQLLRDSQGRVTQSELARRTGRSTTTITAFLTGRFKAGLETGLLIARALSISPWRVLDYHKRIRILRRLEAGIGHYDPLGRRARYLAAKHAGLPERVVFEGIRALPHGDDQDSRLDPDTDNPPVASLRDDDIPEA